MAKIRAPIIAMLGHVDHGKTTLLDKIRGTAIAKGEAGLITQAISVTNVPIKTIKQLCSKLLNQLKTELIIPSLLFIDTPGHEAFTTLRKRGGSIADFAILIVDINEGFKPQTDESLQFLKQFKTPFLVVATKIDKIMNWIPKQNECFLTTFNEQTDRVQEIFEEKLYKLVEQLAERGFNSERYDRIEDFSKQIGIVPVSGVTGEGIPDLLVMLAGLSQKYLKSGLEITSKEGKGTVLEVKEVKGLGTTIDVILYDGEINKNDFLVIGGKEVIKTKVKALLEPAPLKELRSEKKFMNVKSISCAAGLKISAQNLEHVIAGSPLRAFSDEKNMEKAIAEVSEEIEEVEIETKKEGVVLKADTLGSLEALIFSLKNIPIRKAVVGCITKTDIMEIKKLKEPVIFAFGIKIDDNILKIAKDNNVKIFSSDVIYKLLEDYEKWKNDKNKKEKEARLISLQWPCKIRILAKHTFRQKNPAIVGVEVLAGKLKTKSRLMRSDGKIIGTIIQMQKMGEKIEEVVKDDKVAISIEDVVVGKHIKEGDILYVYIPKNDISVIETEFGNKLTEDEIMILEEIKNIK